MRVLLTGMSGTGKSTVVQELAARGYRAIDTDHDGWSGLVEVDPGMGKPLEEGRDWLWNEERMEELLSREDVEVLFVSGAAPNQSKFYSRFDHVVLLTAPESVLIERLTTRTANPYGKRPAERERVLHLKRTVEPMLRRAADVEIDTSAPLDQVIERILAQLR